MAINTNFPNVRPSLLLDFANAQQLDPRVTFSRSTTAPYYDGKTSVLAEQNLLLNSNVFNTTWVLSNLGTGGTAPTIATTTGTLPDGSTGTIYQLTFPTLTAGQASAIYQSVNALHGLTAWSGSVYAQIASGTATIYTVLEDSLAAPSGGNYVTATQTLTTSWQRLTVSGSYSSGAGNAVLVIGFDGRISGQTNPSSLTVNLAFAQLEQRSTPTAYNATTTSAITNYIPQLQTAPINAPRFDFNPTTGESLGLLIEQSSSNLLTYSQDYTNAVWTKATGCTVNNSATIAPDGTQTANSISQTTNGDTNGVYRTGAIFQSGRTVSLYLKASEITSVTAQNGAGQTWTFNLTTGVFSSVNAVYTTSSVSVGNGWWRLQIVLGSVAGTDFFIGATSGASAFNKFYMWGFQIEALAFATSYIPTPSNSQVIRASDNASMTGTNFSSWYNIAQGTFYGEAILSSTANTGYFFSTSAPPNRLEMRMSGTQFTAIFGSTPTSIVGGTVTANTTSKASLSIAPFSATFVGNGSVVGTSTASNMPVPTTMYLGVSYDAVSNNLNGRLKKLAYYPQAVTSAQLQALTGT
jgi:hypothetical protein